MTEHLLNPLWDPKDKKVGNWAVLESVFSAQYGKRSV